MDDLTRPLTRAELLDAFTELRSSPAVPGELVDVLDHLVVRVDEIAGVLERIADLVTAGEQLADQFGSNPMALVGAIMGG